MAWTVWSGYYAVQSYLLQHEQEYFAIRTAAGLLDVSPLCKYRVHGPDSTAFLSRVMVRDIVRLPVGRVAYTCWCDHNGHVIGDGTVLRQQETTYLVTSTDPSYAWFCRHQRGLAVQVNDVTDDLAALALQGPVSREVLLDAGAREIEKLAYYHAVRTSLAGKSIWVSRTGYTGDLGYEIWIPVEHALTVWDALVVSGENYALRPAGLSALDMCRVEAGLLLQHVDYHNALHALVNSRKSTPFELGLGWMVNLDRAPFIGQAALHGLVQPDVKLVGLDIDWSETEALYRQCGLPPALPTRAWRTSVPVYRDRARRRQIGYATSGTWSPVLKKNIALATVMTQHAAGQAQIELTVEHVRHAVTARIVPHRFFNPPRKTAHF